MKIVDSAAARLVLYKECEPANFHTGAHSSMISECLQSCHRISCPIQPLRDPSPQIWKRFRRGIPLPGEGPRKRFIITVRANMVDIKVDVEFRGALGASNPSASYSAASAALTALIACSIREWTRWISHTTQLAVSRNSSGIQIALCYGRASPNEITT
jgi:hypothetical protein